MQRLTRKAWSLQKICFSTKFCLKSCWSRWEGRGTNMRENHHLSNNLRNTFKLLNFQEAEHPLPKSTTIPTPNKRVQSSKPGKSSQHGANGENNTTTLCSTHSHDCIFAVLSILHSTRQIFPRGTEWCFPQVLHQTCSQQRWARTQPWGGSQGSGEKDPDAAQNQPERYILLLKPCFLTEFKLQCFVYLILFKYPAFGS